MSQKPVDIAAVLISATICFVIITSALTPLITGVPLTMDKIKILDHIITSMISVLSLWFGVKIKERIDKD